MAKRRRHGRGKLAAAVKRGYLGERFDRFEDGSTSAPSRQRDAFYAIPRGRQKPRMR